MWIRAQDGFLINMANMEAVKLQKNVYVVAVIAGEGNNGYCLGKYPTEERAKEVLDNLADHLFFQQSESWYNMPKE